MSPTSSIVTIALCCLLIASVQAAPLAAQAGTIELRGELDGSSDVMAVLLLGGRDGVHDIELTAKSAQMLRWVNQGVYGACVGAACPSQSVLVEPQPERIPAEPAQHVQLHSSAPDAKHRLAIFPQGDASLSFLGHRMAASSAQRLCLLEDGFAEGNTGCQGYEEEQVGFTQLPLEGPLQRINASGQMIVLRGDLVVEMEGIQLTGGDLDFDTRQSRTGDAAGTYERPFGRVLLLNATLRIGLDESLQFEWAVREATTLVRGGQATLTDASGSVQLAEGVRPVAAQDVLTGNFMMRSSATQGAITFDVEPRDAEGLPLVAAMPSEPLWPWAAALLVAFFPLVGAVLIVRRHQAHTSMPHVERALQAGHYRRASKLSRRILRHDPMHESASLSRAIALTRVGKAEQAVTELHAFLGRQEPTDGTLHFALGIALLDLARADEARVALHRAVTLTPSLLSELAPDMRPAADDAYT